eukprot:4209009-Prymnesium_polylepis.1
MAHLVTSVALAVAALAARRRPRRPRRTRRRRGRRRQSNDGHRQHEQVLPVGRVCSLLRHVQQPQRVTVGQLGVFCGQIDAL